MRLISSLLVAALAATTLTTSIAAACGGPSFRVDPAPRMLMVSSHGLRANGRWTGRSFVVLENKARPPSPRMWKDLAPGTYDGTDIAMLEPLPSPMELTLVGPSGTRVVKTANQVALKGSWHIGTDQVRAALEVPFEENDQFTIAIPGRVTDATWSELDYKQAPVSTSWWLAKQGFTDFDDVAVRTAPGVNVEFIELSRGGHPQVFVREGDTILNGSAGNALGIVTMNGRTFLVVKLGPKLSTIELPARARS